MLRFLTGDVADGNEEIVRRTLAAARVHPDGRTEQAPATSLFDVIPPSPTPDAPQPGTSSRWQRRPTPDW